MGGYYGIYNLTKHHRVSGYWKGSPPPPYVLEFLSKVYAWDLSSDLIASHSYESGYVFSKGEWRHVDRDNYMSIIGGRHVDSGWTSTGIREPSEAVIEVCDFDGLFFYN